MQFVIWIFIYNVRYCMRKQEYQVKPTPVYTHTQMNVRMKNHSVYTDNGACR